MTDVFDKLQASRPVNSAAARVMGAGFHYKPQKMITQRHWSSPPACLPIPRRAAVNPDFEDLTGISFGRFKVIGYLGKTNPKKPVAWLCRCSCGDYEARSTRAIQNPENRGDRCGYCWHTAHLKRDAAFRANPLAKQPDVRDL